MILYSTTIKETMDYFKKNTKFSHKRDPSRTYVVSDVEISRVNKIYSGDRIVRIDYVGELFDHDELVQETYFISHGELLRNFDLVSINKPEGDSV